jgi:hypothetical protein
MMSAPIKRARRAMHELDGSRSSTPTGRPRRRIEMIGSLAGIAVVGAACTSVSSSITRAVPAHTTTMNTRTKTTSRGRSISAAGGCTSSERATVRPPSS